MGIMKLLLVLSLPWGSAVLAGSPPAAPAAQHSDLKAYVVRPGDCLWSIAAKPEVLGDAFLWPLLYDQNHAFLRDPRRLEPGQTLAFRPSYGAYDEFRARKRARYDGWPGPAKR